MRFIQGGRCIFQNKELKDAVQKVSTSFLRRYTLPKFQTLVKFITLIINRFCGMLCRGVLQTPT